MKEKKWGKMDWKQYRKKSGKKDQNTGEVPKQESSESLDEWIENFQLWHTDDSYILNYGTALFPNRFSKASRHSAESERFFRISLIACPSLDP